LPYTKARAPDPVNPVRMLQDTQSMRKIDTYVSGPFKCFLLYLIFDFKT